MADEVMAEGKAKKPGLLRRILWWLWVILLTALLVLGFVFAAPWKAITLVAIFLAAATILPRIYRKWFWFCVGLVIIALVVWIFLPDDNKDWRPYTFDKELAQLQAKYAVPDSENAAVLYNQILADWKQKDTNEPDLPDQCGWFSIVGHGPWSKKDQPEIAAYLKYHQDIIEQLVQAGKFQRCSFPIIADVFVSSKQMERISTMRRWAYLLIAAANNDMAEGKTNEALEKYLTVLRMGQHSGRQPSVIEMLVGVAIESLGLGGVNNFVVLGNANEPYLNKVEQAVSEIHLDWNSDLPDFVASDKLMFKNMMGLFYEVNSKGKIRFSRDPSATIREQTQKQLDNETIDFPEFFSSYWWKKLMKAYTIPAWFFAPATPEELGRIIDASFEKHYRMTKPDFDWSKESENHPPEFHFKMNIQQIAELMAQINKSVYPGLHNIYLRIAAQQRGTLLIIAMRRYKNANHHWPDSLDDIKTLAPAEVFVDPTNNGSFVYKRTDDGFTLYSRGKNGIDDGGIDSDTEDKNGPDDSLIWPHQSKTSQQQEQKATEQ